MKKYKERMLYSTKEMLKVFLLNKLSDDNLLKVLSERRNVFGKPSITKEKEGVCEACGKKGCQTLDHEKLSKIKATRGGIEITEERYIDTELTEIEELRAEGDLGSYLNYVESIKLDNWVDFLQMRRAEIKQAKQSGKTEDLTALKKIVCLNDDQKKKATEIWNFWENEKQKKTGLKYIFTEDTTYSKFIELIETADFSTLSNKLRKGFKSAVAGEIYVIKDEFKLNDEWLELSAKSIGAKIETCKSKQRNRNIRKRE